MLRRTFAGGATAVALIIAGPAFAADMPVPDYSAPPPAAAPVALPVAYDWSGVYVGVNAGYGWGDFTSSGGLATFGPGFDFDDDVFVDGTAPFAGGSLDANGFLGGAQIGANWQVNQLVFGLEADFQWTGMDTGTGTSTIIEDDFTTGGFVVADDSLDVSTSEDLRWFGTVRGRVGMAFDRFMPYVTGGLAYGRAEATTGFAAFDDDGFAVGSSISSTDRQGHLGWTVGAGVEAALTDNLSLKAEYLYVDLGSETYNFAYSDGADGTATATRDVDFDAHIVRAGLNYRFNMF